ncbi:hypothetical protein MLD38_009594 [Melastoma candidum]|uniref:Uncharacterized protein n=1 Tax=Melastoma candidum TaxID=119954 RepID=A0ACB9RYL3_9MYRT|nr:hypothetical protein MLD38_009594 [Melastoma candidum]
MGRDVSRSVSFAIEKDGLSERSPRSSFKARARVLSRVFSEDFGRARSKILDPRGQTVRLWNKIFMAACLVSLFVDPLFFYLPIVRKEQCIEIAFPLEISLAVVRSVADVFYVIHMFIRSRTAYVAPSSRVLGRGELVIDSSKVASRYLHGGFWVDLLAALPLPQIIIWIVIPLMRGSTVTNTKDVLRFIVILQYLPRLFLILPLWSQIVQAAGVITQTAWAGAAYNLMLYMLASHVLGACWYLLTVEAQQMCWRNVCDMLNKSCDDGFFDCHKAHNPVRDAWFKSSNISYLCDPASNFYDFGIYGEAVTAKATGSPFFNKYFYGLWWGLKNLSCFGQTLETSTSVGEISFTIFVATLGLVFFALLIGNVQTYLQSMTVRLEQWRIQRTDIEQWMHHRQLPTELRESVRKHDQFKWAATKGVDEESILRGLPLDLRRAIKRHLCLDLVRQVNLFDQMDEKMLDAICERLKPALYTKGTCLVREGDLVHEMLFIIRGHLNSYTTNGGSTGFLNTCRIGPGDFCGEELLTWALNPRRRVVATPSSTRTVRAESEVEAFALRGEDLKFVASQFRRMHSKQLQHRFRFYSHQWRTWAACTIQVAWRLHRKRKLAQELSDGETGEDAPNGSNAYSRQRPAEPDFSVDDEEMPGSR